MASKLIANNGIGKMEKSRKNINQQLGSGCQEDKTTIKPQNISFTC